jgi:hypothetical protein
MFARINKQNAFVSAINERQEQYVSLLYEIQQTSIEPVSFNT